MEPRKSGCEVEVLKRRRKNANGAFMEADYRSKFAELLCRYRRGSFVGNFQHEVEKAGEATI